MKKLILFFSLILFSSSVMKAQTATPVTGGNGANFDANAWLYEQNDLLKDQNKLLSSRKTALTITVCSAAVATVGELITVIGARSGQTNPAGVAVSIVGGIGMLTGGIWFLVNEYKMIDMQKQINNHLALKYSGNGVALVFSGR